MIVKVPDKSPDNAYLESRLEKVELEFKRFKIGILLILSALLLMIFIAVVSRDTDYHHYRAPQQPYYYNYNYMKPMPYHGGYNIAPQAEGEMAPRGFEPEMEAPDALIEPK